MKLNVIIWKEDDVFIVREIFTGVTTQGETIEEAINNIKEAVELYLEEKPEIKEELEKKDVIGVLNVEIAKIIG
jgi:predicted RNase H-like HicB family nuclease